MKKVTLLCSWSALPLDGGEVCDDVITSSWWQRNVRWRHHILLMAARCGMTSLLLDGAEVCDDVITSSWWRRGLAAAQRTWVGLQGCTASSAASLYTRRQGNAEDMPSCNLATRRREWEELMSCFRSYCMVQTYLSCVTNSWDLIKHPNKNVLIK